MVNNDFYGELGLEGWDRKDHPIALLRAEARLKNPWVLNTIRRYQSNLLADRQSKGPSMPPFSVLDIGCGAGYLTTFLSDHGYKCTGLDQSAGALDVARTRDTRRGCDWVLGNASALPFPDSSFDVVAVMDVLEHVKPWSVVVTEGARVLKPSGFLLFHTFNRTVASLLLADWALRALFPAGPQNVHRHSWFIKPRELQAQMERVGLRVLEWTGLKPVMKRPEILSFLESGNLPDSFSFASTRSLSVGYMGIAVKTGEI